MYPKTPGCFSDLSAALYYKSYCFFLKLLIVLPVHFPLLHFTPPKVLRFYYNLTFRCVRYFGGSADCLDWHQCFIVLCLTSLVCFRYFSEVYTSKILNQRWVWVSG